MSTIILITGGNRGLGRAYVEAILKGPKASTYKIIITARNAEAAKTAAKELSETQVAGYGCDIEDEEQVKQLIKAVEGEYGRVDILINNAGMCPFLQAHLLTSGAAYDGLAQKGEMTPKEAWTKSYSLNVTCTHFFTEAFVPLLLKSQTPSIIFISSRVGSITSQVNKGIPSMDSPPEAGWPKKPGFNPTAYRSSKAAFNMMAREWYRTLLNDGVKCYILAMSGYATDFGGGKPEDKAAMGMPGPEVAGEWVRGFVDGKHEGEEGKFMALDGEHGW
jgi:NAD(P)-dependent dehydrogenase (short-subunit alcohol dehydrogenase family)